MNGKPFAPYSKRYIDSQEFRVAGKSASNVDLRFTHEMMNSMEVLSTATGSVTIGFSNPAADKKAEWAEASDNGPSRKFFGVTDSEIESIVAQHAAPENATRSLSMEILQRILGRG